MIVTMMVGGSASGQTARREVLDSVVASVDTKAITRTDVEVAYGFELLLNGQTPITVPDTSTLEAVRDRQIDQLLLSHEADLENISAADESDSANQMFGETRKKFRTQQDFLAALRLLGMDEAEALAHLRERQRILTLIDRRLRPSARVEPPDVEDYYKKVFLPEWSRKSSAQAPPQDEVEDQIREILTQKKINELLGAWLDNLKTNHRVTVFPIQPH